MKLELLILFSVACIIAPPKELPEPRQKSQPTTSVMKALGAESALNKRLDTLEYRKKKEEEEAQERHLEIRKLKEELANGKKPGFLMHKDPKALVARMEQVVANGGTVILPWARTANTPSQQEQPEPQPMHNNDNGDNDDEEICMTQPHLAGI